MDNESKKSSESNQPGFKQDVPSIYNRVLDRLTDTLENVEHHSWDYLQEKIEEAVELELTAEEMTRDEMDLLTAYLKRDLKQLGYYAHETGEGIAAWLHFDLNVLENTVVEKLVALADQTRIDQERLREQLANEADEYMAGEIAAVGTFECQSCQQQMQLKKTSLIEPCKACGAEHFRRISRPWSALDII
ncbi:zinc ribbon-containing protein [Neptunomonas qingdaonensis]|uniref:Zinc-ribbon containing domain-containing protein n=1 Tax=Neptunomonas qingdaonensis TaxID=1045558 RepID=A0A1I2NH43_9GAMM|nr:zinc ribbon-containing protein [Neptunomonas qingdaonensis]SFG00786.1 Zinc-ribbon containing domain-containing protein [Neptunomonas qingdaonensis]